MTTRARIVSALVVGLFILTGAVAVAAAAREDDPTQNRMTVTEQLRHQTRQATQTQERDRTDPEWDRRRVRLQDRDCTQDCIRGGVQSQQRVRARDRVHAPGDCVRRQDRDRIHGRDHAHDQARARLRDGSCLADDAS